MSGATPAFRGSGDGKGHVTAQDALLWYCDIKQLTLSTLTAFQGSLRCPRAASTLGKLIASATELQDYLLSRELVDVLEEWDAHCNCSPSASLTLISTLRPLQPRFYSVSSSPLLDKNTMALTVAVVRYRAHGRVREGVTSTYLKDTLPVGGQCAVFVSFNPDFRLPDKPTVPVILICAGTGIAPFIAFLQERELAGRSGYSHLYFGCRHPDKDFLYKTQLESWVEKGVVRLRVAFSRQQQQKVYVQHLLLEDSLLLWSLISQECAVVYVCGDARHMAPDVNRTLQSIIQQHKECTPQEADDYLTQLEQSGQYRKDVWLG